MKLEFQFGKSARKLSLWRVLLVAAVVGSVLGLLPERIGLPIVFAIEAALILALLFILSMVIFRRVTRN